MVPCDAELVVLGEHDDPLGRLVQGVEARRERSVTFEVVHVDGAGRHPMGLAIGRADDPLPLHGRPAAGGAASWRGGWSDGSTGQGLACDSSVTLFPFRLWVWVRCGPCTANTNTPVPGGIGGEPSGTGSLQIRGAGPLSGVLRVTVR